MSMLLILVPLSLLLVIVAVWALLWAVSNGQFDDLETPAWDILIETESASVPKSQQVGLAPAASTVTSTVAAHASASLDETQ